MSPNTALAAGLALFMFGAVALASGRGEALQVAGLASICVGLGAIIAGVLGRRS